jgi:predicted NUDIX family NTP pyrophosphohydrolase
MPSHGFCNRSRRKKNMIVIVPAQIAFYGQRDDASIKYVKDCNQHSVRAFTVWPPKSGKLKALLEVDRAEWFNLEATRSRILSGQIDLIDRLEKATDG